MFGRTGWVNQILAWIGIEQLVDIHSPFGVGLVQVFFFFPYALVFRRLGAFGLLEMGLFVLILLVGYIYIVKRGALQWE